MKKLMLLRHAKSSWKDDTLADIDRPLSKRGRQAAKLVRDHIRSEKLQPGQILCSPARRTRDTLDWITEAFAEAVPTRFERPIYMAEPATLLRRLRRLSESLGSAMVIGHNPGLERLALMLTEGSDDDGRRAMASKFPTGALAVLDCNVEHWTELASGCARLASFVSPRQLDGK
jgi:phosphohistidine phosphatase